MAVALVWALTYSLEVQVILRDIVNQPTHEGDIGTCANGGVNIGHLRGTREVRVNVNDRCTVLFCLHDPAETDRVTFGKVAALDENAVAIL